MSKKQRLPGGTVPGATRPQASRMQPVVRNRGLRNTKKPKGGK